MSDAFPDHFSSVAAAYLAFRPGYPPALFEWLASLAPSRERAVDVGCGSGQASVALAACFEEVIAVDPSAEQIARAEAHPRVYYRVASAEDTGVPTASVDLVIAAQAFHWFSAERFRCELARIGRAGAVFAAFTYDLCRVDSRVDEIVDRLYSSILEPYWPLERAHVESAYRTLPFPCPEIVTPRLSMEESWTLDRFIGFLGTWSAAIVYRGTKGGDPLSLVAGDLRAAWGPPDRSRTVKWNLTVRAGRIGSGTRP